MAESVVTEVDRTKFRPFTLGDAMILIIALALGLAVARPAISSLAFKVRSLSRSTIFGRLGAVLALARTLNIIVLSFLLFLLPAFVILRLKRPRAPLRSVVRQPGFAACAAAPSPSSSSLCPLRYSALLGSSGKLSRSASECCSSSLRRWPGYP